MKVALALCLLGLKAAQAMDPFELVVKEWETWKLMHGKNYPKNYGDNMKNAGHEGNYGQEEIVRMIIWLENKAKIDRHNRQALRGMHSHDLAMNEWGDLLHREFVAAFNGYKARPANFSGELPRGAKHLMPAHKECLPENVDWREYGAVTPVKNQGRCGSCWAFSTTGALEAMHHRATGKLVSLSEQNLVDCSGEFGNQGCKGGLMDSAFQYIEENGGIDTEASYPYVGEQEKCRYNPAFRGATDIGFMNVEAGNEAALKTAVATQGPCSVAIDASLESFQFYRSGVYRARECSAENLDHGVLVIGYGVEEETKEAYWLIKNSWGTSWGLEGYIKIARNDGNMCGVASTASYPLV